MLLNTIFFWSRKSKNDKKSKKRQLVDNILDSEVVKRTTRQKSAYQLLDERKSGCCVRRERERERKARMENLRHCNHLVRKNECRIYLWIVDWKWYLMFHIMTCIIEWNLPFQLVSFIRSLRYQEQKRSSVFSRVQFIHWILDFSFLHARYIIHIVNVKTKICKLQ